MRSSKRKTDGKHGGTLCRGECEPCHSALRGLHFQPKGLYRECLARGFIVIPWEAARGKVGTSRRDFRQLTASHKTCQDQQPTPSISSLETSHRPWPRHCDLEALEEDATSELQTPTPFPELRQPRSGRQPLGLWPGTTCLAYLWWLLTSKVPAGRLANRHRGRTLYVPQMCKRLCESGRMQADAQMQAGWKPMGSLRLMLLRSRGDMHNGYSNSLRMKCSCSLRDS